MGPGVGRHGEDYHTARWFVKINIFSVYIRVEVTETPLFLRKYAARFRHLRARNLLPIFFASRGAARPGRPAARRSRAPEGPRARHPIRRPHSIIFRPFASLPKSSTTSRDPPRFCPSGRSSIRQILPDSATRLNAPIERHGYDARRDTGGGGGRERGGGAGRGRGRRRGRRRGRGRGRA